MLLREDRSSKGGGVCAFVERSMNIVAIDISTTFSTLEVVCYDVMFSSCDKLRFFVVYRPPYYDNIAYHYLQSLIKCFTQFTTCSQTNIIVEDFNCPGIN